METSASSWPPGPKATSVTSRFEGGAVRTREPLGSMAGRENLQLRPEKPPGIVAPALVPEAPKWRVYESLPSGNW